MVNVDTQNSSTKKAKRRSNRSDLPLESSKPNHNEACPNEAIEKQGKDSYKARYIFYFFSILLISIAIASVVLYYDSILSNNSADIISTISISLLFPSIVISYMMAKGNNISGIIKSLGLSRDKLNFKYIIIGIVLFAAIMGLDLAFSSIAAYLHISFPTNVKQVFSGMPLYFLIFSFTVAPIDEEILFRGFLVPRIGVIQSAFLFAILHFGYGSISEILFAFIFGLMAGYAFKRTKSLYISIIGHILVNMLTIILLFVI